MVDILIRNGIVLTQDQQGRIIYDGSVAISQGRILDVGPTDKLLLKYKADIVLDASKKAVLPGLVNTHSHFYQSLMKGSNDNEPLKKWALNRLMPMLYVRNQCFIKDNLEGDYYATLMACIESIRFGSTTILGMDGMNPRICEAFQHIGIRGIHALQMADQWVPEEVLQPREDQVRDAKKIRKRWHNTSDGRIKIFLGPATPYICSKSYLEEIMDIARHWNSPVQIHLAEAPYEAKLVKKEQGLTPIKYLESIGLLKLKTIAVHCIWLTKEEKNLLKKYDVSISHNPESNMKLGSGVMDLPWMLKQGVNVALATDGAASNDNLNMFGAIRAASLLHRVTYRDPTIINSHTLLQMATINGARALGLDQEIGSIEIGKRADIILIDLSKPHTRPLGHVENMLVYCSLGSDVETVIIDGKIVMRDRTILTVNEEDVMKEAERIKCEYLEEANEYRGSPVIQNPKKKETN
jgi:5-methylthioadenosine/S-adenosylhomocysteine deaminase